MLGLTSRDALTSRQTRWVRDVDTTIKTQPSKNHDSSAKQLTKQKGIISYMNEPLLSDDKELSSLYKRCDVIDEKLQEIETYQTEILANVKKLMGLHSNLDRFIKNLSSNNSTTFVPYFNNEAFVGIDNMCKLTGNELQFVIEIFGNIKDKVVLYPFGNVSNVSNVSNSIKQLTIQAYIATGIQDIIVEIKQSADGLCVIELPVVDASLSRVSYFGVI
jgi:hypothetical protein